MNLEGVCKLYTRLNSDEIEIIRKNAEILPTIAEFIGADVFIDCPTREKDIAVVVAQARAPKETSYKREVIGEFATKEKEPAVLRTIETGLPSRKYKAVTQENNPVMQDVLPIKNILGEVIGAFIAEVVESKDSYRKKNILESTTLKLLGDFSQYKNDVIDFLKEGIIVFSANGKAIYCNSTAKNTYEKIGVNNEIVGQNFDNLIFNNFTFKNLVDNLDKNISIKKETNILDKFFKVEYFITRKDEGLFNVYMVIRDITEEKRKDKEIILKSVAIQEIHHRVKNNLQTVASLLRMQKRRVKDLETKKILEESINRVISIALTHEILSQNGFDNLEIKTIIRLMCKSFKKTSIDKSKKISFNIIGDNFLISSDKATSIALIINEVLQNANDYAFKNNEEGKIEIKVKKEPFYSKVSISDNGVGIDEINLDGGLGLSIIKTIVLEKLNGNLYFESAKDKGTTVSFDFKNN